MRCKGTPGAGALHIDAMAWHGIVSSQARGHDAAMSNVLKDPQAEAMARRLGMQAHPEGGWYRETHRSSTILHSETHGQRAAFTSILYLLEHPAVSRLHRLDAEELWNWHAGAALNVYVLWPDGQCVTHRLGPAPTQSFQVVVPAGCWFGAEVEGPGVWSLVGCVVAPGFEFRAFELADRAALLRAYPDARSIVERLT
jgi:predicted cupin superfamily sugar epimerase